MHKCCISPVVTSLYLAVLYQQEAVTALYAVLSSKRAWDINAFCCLLMARKLRPLNSRKHMHGWSKMVITLI